jgi:uncharacterized glyoxalase superfamily protein PhnB/predicted kinase
METNAHLIPLLVVRDASRAIEFYVKALGAHVVARYEHGSDKRVSHADLAVGDQMFSLTEEARAWNSDAPPSLGGTPVVLQWFVANADAAFASMLGAGATIVFPVGELFGERMGRVRDPFGHLWLLRQCIEELSVEEIQRRRDELFARLASQAGPEEASKVDDHQGVRQGAPRAHLVIGPVGAGKSTFALRLARERVAVRLTLDEWMSRLFSPDRPESGVVQWYVERAARAVDQIWSVAKSVLEAGRDVVLEVGLLSRRERAAFYERAVAARVRLTVHVLDAPREVRRERVEARNREKGETFSMVVPPAIFEMASDMWEAPDDDERASSDVDVVIVDVT